MLLVSALAVSALPAWAAAPPDWPGRAETLAACAHCHAIDVVISLQLARRQWEVQVETMIIKGAAVRDEDFDLIVDYLLQHAGPAAPAAAPVQLPGGSGWTPAPG
ncbi:MAG: hypothetical protein ACKO4A_06050 [Gammaproteobacteria bacterium]